RLAEHLQQRAFWSQHLYEHAARRLARSLAVPGLVLAAALALMAVPLDGLPLVVVKVTTVLVAGFVGIDWLGTCLEWRAAAAEASRTDARLLATPEPDWEGTIAVFGDYSVAVASVPPIPTAIHGREERRLDGLWAARLQASRDGRVATSS
ncbi:MAG: hypothetical protein OXT09_36225, partial [Myxococcales bacterium]|nr:hypothetical protein [Myxococcales bacterium]